MDVSGRRDNMAILAVTFRSTVNLRHPDIHFLKCGLKFSICAFQFSNRLLQNYLQSRMRTHSQKSSQLRTLNSLLTIPLWSPAPQVLGCVMLEYNVVLSPLLKEL